MASKRRNYTREFKIEAVRLVTENGSGIREAAESLGVSQNSLRVWRKQLEREADNAFPGKGKVSSRDEQVRRLQEEIRRLRMERDILKKATAFFANDQN
jgi:transposase